MIIPGLPVAIASPATSGEGPADVGHQLVQGAGVTSFTVNCAPGELLLAFVCNWSSFSLSTPSGWTLRSSAAHPGANSALFCYYRVATATSHSFSPGAFGGVSLSAVVHRITGANQARANSVTGISTNPNPPLLSQEQAAHHRWYAAASDRDGDVDGGVIAAPAGMTGFVGDIVPVTAQVDGPSSQSYDPASFPLNSTTYWAAMTVAVWQEELIEA
jgi:hypothetical protein